MVNAHNKGRQIALLERLYVAKMFPAGRAGYRLSESPGQGRPDGNVTIGADLRVQESFPEKLSIIFWAQSVVDTERLHISCDLSGHVINLKTGHHAIIIFCG
jgi:hypothetical protein